MRFPYKKVLGSNYVELLVRIVVAIALFMSFYTAYQAGINSKCQAHFAEENARVQNVRSAAASADNSARDKLFMSLYRAISKADVDAAYTEYFITRAKTDQDRLNNPLPQPPSKFC